MCKAADETVDLFWFSLQRRAPFPNKGDSLVTLTTTVPELPHAPVEIFTSTFWTVQNRAQAIYLDSYAAGKTNKRKVVCHEVSNKYNRRVDESLKIWVNETLRNYMCGRAATALVKTSLKRQTNNNSLGTGERGSGDGWWW